MNTFTLPPTSSIDWRKPNYGEIQDVNGHIESTYHRATGKWTPLKFVPDPYLRIHGLATGLNYGQQALEGLKAFRMPGEPGNIAIFRLDRNALRLQRSAHELNMPTVPIDTFIKACHAAVALNAEYVPPHASDWALYIRPLLFVSGPKFKPGVADETKFCVYVFPTYEGPRIEKQAVKALILDDFDRAAPKGTGHAKVGANYAGVLRWSNWAESEGFGMTLQLDSARHEEVDEFSLSGFVGVKYLVSPVSDDNNINDNNDVTILIPDTSTAIESVTSESVQEIARSWGWKVEKRTVPYTELPTFNEVLGAGTAMSLTPVRSITRQGVTRRLPPSQRVQASSDGSETIVYIPNEQKGGGPVFEKLLRHLKDIQLGKVKDEFGWRFEIQIKDIELIGE